MGNYLNPTSDKFKECLNSRIYVDKSELIHATNENIGTLQKYMCVSRPRRFGKSMAANMLAAYYSSGDDTRALFGMLKISKGISYETHLNKHDVIMLNMQEFLSKSDTVEEMLSLLQKRVLGELSRAYSYIDMDESHLDWAMQDIFCVTERSFIILIDEWDCLFREFRDDLEAQKKYLDFLRMWLKDQAYVGLAYMTGILPIKKYGTHSALNMFSEFSMTDPGKLAEYFGFTDCEVKNLCADYGMSFEETQSWYNGYTLTMEQDNRLSVYNPKSVVEAMLNRSFQNYWNRTETYEALQKYVKMNYDGLKDAVVTMLAGGRVRINIEKFGNDMTTFRGKDDVLTLLVHLGYLTYDRNDTTVLIPNREVAQEYRNSIEDLGWDGVMNSLSASQELLQALWREDAETIAAGIDKVHAEVSILQYNDENALSYTINLAFYSAREYYNIYREFPTGKGFADLCFVPRRRHADKPAIVIELKWNKSAQGALSQIKERGYVENLAEYRGNILLVGVNYDRKTKKHSCVIEKGIWEGSER